MRCSTEVCNSLHIVQANDPELSGHQHLKDSKWISTRAVVEHIALLLPTQKKHVLQAANESISAKNYGLSLIIVMNFSFYTALFLLIMIFFLQRHVLAACLE
jgi:hypothetical protein